MDNLRMVLIQIFIILFSILSIISCASQTEGSSTTDNDIIDVGPEIQEDKDTAIETEEDTYSIWTDPCVECAWYFCGNLDAVWQKQICINNCDAPPTIVYESMCEEHLECNPTQFVLESNIPCVTEDGFPGFKEKLCNKGQIQYTDCKSDCSEEICDLLDNDCDGDIDEGVKNACDSCGDVPEETCDYIDNDCDGQIDEGQLNACGECGPLNEELCDNIDNDCNGLTDEDLIGECSTICEANLQYCVEGQWICTAKQPKPEVCNGLDDDCDGLADEGLNCLCTVSDIGALIPCKENPLICGEGYKVCECADESCSELQLSECLAVCHWIPATIPAGSTCDKYLGEIIPEECNNHDDNCNDQIDEGLIAGCYSGAPETMLVGICLPGEMTCLEGSWGNYDDNNVFIKKLCLGEVTPQPEDICNGTDTNCDGKIDKDKELEPTDILFIVDLSGSMKEEINAVTLALNHFAVHYNDSDIIKWGLVFTASYTDDGDQVVLATDLVDLESFMIIFQSMGFTLFGGEEQNYDAIYMAIHNLVGAASLPYELTDLTWISPWGWGSIPAESDPPKDTWNISWRDDAKHVIILFSDEEGQTYLEPNITEDILVNVINAADELAVYAFTLAWMIDSGSTDNYVALTEAGMKGKAYPLTMKAIEMYSNLLEILDETACGGE